MGKVGRANAFVLATMLVLTACGGGDDGLNGLEEDVFGDLGDASADVQSAGGSTEIGQLTQSADPSTGWVEVDGQRYDFDPFGSVHYTCEILEDRITINFQQTTSGNDFLLQGSIMNDQWNANLTFVPAGDEQVQYSANIGTSPGTFGIGDQAISFEGTLSRIVDRDITNPEDVEGAIAVNCSAPGGAPTAVIEGETFTFPLSGSSPKCAVSPTEVEISIAHSRPERLQLQVDIEDNGGELFGAAHVTSGEDKYTSFIPSDGSGLTIDGKSLNYEGTFTTPGGDEVVGSVSVSCG